MYKAAEIPPPGEMMHVKLSEIGLRDLNFYCPLGDMEAKLLSDYCIAALFRALSLEHILHFVSSILLERQVLVISRSLGVLSSAILSAIPILRPLVWQGLLVPLVPSNMKETLHAPVPYILGVSKRPAF